MKVQNRAAHLLTNNVTVGRRGTASLAHITGNSNLRAVLWAKINARPISRLSGSVIAEPEKRPRSISLMNSARYVEITEVTPFDCLACGHTTKRQPDALDEPVVRHPATTVESVGCNWSFYPRSRNHTSPQIQQWAVAPPFDCSHMEFLRVPA